MYAICDYAGITAALVLLPVSIWSFNAKFRTCGYLGPSALLLLLLLRLHLRAKILSSTTVKFTDI